LPTNTLSDKIDSSSRLFETATGSEVGKTMRIDRVWLLIFVALFVGGCGSHSNLPAAIQVLAAIAFDIRRKRFLQFESGDPVAQGKRPRDADGRREDRHKMFFVFRRGASILSRNPSLASDKAGLQAKIEAQLTAVEQFLAPLTDPPNGKLTTPSEPNGATNGSNTDPFVTSLQFHIDLADAAMELVGFDAPPNLVSTYVRGRINAARDIVWRFTALTDEIWSSNGDGATLNALALAEALDRRLRSIERMRLQINAGRSDAGVVRAPGGDGRHLWTDESRVRVFEYPYFPAVVADPADVGPAGVWTPFPAFVNPPVTYQYEVQFSNAPAVNTRFNPERPPRPFPFSSDWPLVPGSGYTRAIAAPSPGAALDQLLQSSLDVWGRTWLFCDHSIAACHLEALRFGLARRPPVNPGEFDALLTQKPAVIGPILEDIAYDPSGNPFVPDRGTLFQDQSANRVMDNLFVNINDLQVGDHTILWNHDLYLFVTSGAWRLENAFVTEVDVDVLVDEEKKVVIEPKINPDLMRFDGFGEFGNVPRFRQKLFDAFKVDFANVYDQIAHLSAGVTAFINPRSAARGLVFRWEAYQPLGLTGEAGPWFIFLPRRPNAPSVWPDVATMLKNIPNSLIDDSPAGPGHNPLSTATFNPPITQSFADGVLFPLYMPVVNNTLTSWSQYFKLRAANANLQGTLRRVQVGTNVIPALEVRGSQNPIQVIRPRARP
jgi:hypothetical protein